MMTPSELREYEFKGAGRNAYKSDDVDNFFGEVAVAYEKIYRENAELVKRVSLLADRLEQSKENESQIKQAILGAQKAADIIVKEAEASVEDLKAESEAVLAAAKGEAEVIKADAEKQAIADSDLLLSIARDKAEEIINKAKEEAHGILIAANDSASDTVGAATRTITSESIHYEMLKKEVSDFRASILAQYKAHIELISKLPELAVEELGKEDESLTQEPSTAEEPVDTVSIDEKPSLEFINDSDKSAEDDIDSAETDDEDVVKTTLPYDFFDESAKLEFVDNESGDDIQSEDVESAETFANSDTNLESDDSEKCEPVDEVHNNESVSAAKSEDEPQDIPISKKFFVNTLNFEKDFEAFSEDDKEESATLFNSFETISSDVEDEDKNSDTEEPKKKHGFFRRKK